jgi:hypothetical protein
MSPQGREIHLVLLKEKVPLGQTSILSGLRQIVPTQRMQQCNPNQVNWNLMVVKSDYFRADSKELECIPQNHEGENNRRTTVLCESSGLA